MHDDEVVVAFEQQRVVEHLLEVDALHRGVHSMSAPCRPLCTALVTAKNSSLPCITCQSASMPTLRSSGTWVASSSATPPPYAVALTWSTRAPCSGFGQLADLVDDVGADHARVVVEVLLEQGDAVEHGHSGGAGDGNLGQSIE